MIEQKYFNKVKNHFKGDDKKTWEWFNSINPFFGMLSPFNMIKLGRQNKVQEFINKEFT